MKEKFRDFIKMHETILLTVLVALIGLIVFICIYGVDVINVTNDTWLHTGGDLNQHYYGWIFFRNADWSLKLGNFNTLSYPHYTSVIFTGSIPLFAVFFKLISGILPETFQYFGIFGMLCYVLQGIFAFILLRKYINNKLFQVVRLNILYNISLYITKDVYTHSTFCKLFDINRIMLICI